MKEFKLDCYRVLGEGGELVGYFTDYKVAEAAGKGKLEWNADAIPAIINEKIVIYDTQEEWDAAQDEVLVKSALKKLTAAEKRALNLF